MLGECVFSVQEQGACIPTELLQLVEGQLGGASRCICEGLRERSIGYSQGSVCGAVRLDLKDCGPLIAFGLPDLLGELAQLKVEEHERDCTAKPLMKLPSDARSENDMSPPPVI